MAGTTLETGREVGGPAHAQPVFSCPLEKGLCHYLLPQGTKYKVLLYSFEEKY